MDYPFPTVGYDLITAEASGDQIEELIGTTFPICTNTMLFCQTSRNRPVQDFLDADAPTQQQIFRTLFNLNYYEEALSFVNKDFKVIEADLLGKKAKCTELEIQIEGKLSVIKSLEEARDIWRSEKEAKLEALDEAIQAVDIELHENNATLIQKTFDQTTAQVNTLTLELESLKKDFSNKLTSYLGKLATIESLKKDIEKAESTIASLSVPLKKPDVFSVDAVKSLREKVSKVNEEINSLREYRSEHLDEQRTLTHDLTFLKQSISRDTTSLTKQRTQRLTIMNARAALESSINSMDCCPTCNQAFAAPSAHLAATADLSDRLSDLALPPLDDDLEAAIATVTQRVTKEIPDRLNEVEITLTKIEKALVFQTSELNAFIAQIEHLLEKEKAWATYEIRLEERGLLLIIEQKSLTNLQIKLAEIHGQVKESLATKDTAESRIATTEESLASSKDALAVLANRIEVTIKPLEASKRRLTIESQSLTTSQFPTQLILDSQTNALDGYRADLRAEELLIIGLNDQYSLLESINTAFGKDGIVAELFREYIPEIQALADKHLSDLTNGELCVDFLPEKELKKKSEDGSRAVKNQFNIQVRKAVGGSAYDLISGSEQNKAVLVVNWALSDLAYRESNIHCNLRVFDEIFDALDAKGMERLAQIILNRKDGVTWVITHKVELEDVFQHKIVLEKVAGASRLKAIV